jgi:hypothetical protein
MCKIVAKAFLKILLVFVVMLTGFGFAFHIMNRDASLSSGSDLKSTIPMVDTNLIEDMNTTAIPETSSISSSYLSSTTPNTSIEYSDNLNSDGDYEDEKVSENHSFKTTRIKDFSEDSFKPINRRRRSINQQTEKASESYLPENSSSTSSSVETSSSSSTTMSTTTEKTNTTNLGSTIKPLEVTTKANNHNSSTDDRSDPFNKFQSPELVIAKIISMFTGEFDAASMEITWYKLLIFVLFVFSQIVVFNLMNALAIDDIEVNYSQPKNQQ